MSIEIDWKEYSKTIEEFYKYQIKLFEEKLRICLAAGKASIKHLKKGGDNRC